MSLAPIADLLDRAPNVAVAVETSRGPHVTPELFVTSGDRIWCLAAAPTLKAKLLTRRPRAGLLLRAGDDAAVVAADALVIDPARPLAALTEGFDAVRSPAIVAAFLAKHHMEMAGAALDAASLQLGAPPPRRVLLGFRPVAHAILAGGELVEASGWEPASSTAAGDGSDVDDVAVPLNELPGGLAAVLDGPVAALGWMTPTGPLALPVAWEHTASQATLAAAVFGAVGAPAAGPASLMVDQWTGLGPTGKRGVMLRGVGEATAESGTTTVTVTADRATWWQGIKTGTVPAA